MPLFRIRGRKASRIAPQEHRIKEDVIHRLIEENLSVFFEDLVLVARKPRIGGKEFDTLALNRTTNSPVIIEYKRGKDRGVVEQVHLYYVKLRHNKSDVMIMLDKADLVENLEDVDFDNPQIMVIAKEFTPEQRELLTIMRDYLRLFRYQLYADSVVSIEEVEPVGLPTSSGGRGRAGRPVSVGPYDIEHFGMSPDVMKLYQRLDKEIASLDSRVRPGKINKHFIGYGATGNYFCSVKPRASSIMIEVKLSHKPPSIRSIRVRSVPGYQHTAMTHVFQISSGGQLKPALRVIKDALEDSL